MALTQARSRLGQRGLLVGRRYVALVASLPQVRQVLLEETALGPRIWTVIEAEPFNRDRRESLYQAELDALEAEPDLSLDFRIINLAEHRRPSSQVIPERASALWQR